MQQQHQSWPRVVAQQGAMEEGDTQAGRQAGMREMEAAWEYQEMATHVSPSTPLCRTLVQFIHANTNRRLRLVPVLENNSDLGCLLSA